MLVETNIHIDHWGQRTDILYGRNIQTIILDTQITPRQDLQMAEAIWCIWDYFSLKFL